MRDNSSRRLENRICNEENQRSNGVAITNIGFQIVVHTSDGSIRPVRILALATDHSSQSTRNEMAILHVASIDKRDAVHQPQNHNQPPINAMDNLALLSIAKFLIVVGVVDESALAFLQVLAVRALKPQGGRVCFDVVLSHGQQ